LLRGCEVVALTDSTAAIRHPSGSITTYRRFNKPALGPPGYTHDDFDGGLFAMTGAQMHSFWACGWHMGIGLFETCQKIRLGSSSAPAWQI
jgi:hypothetical protein